MGQKKSNILRVTVPGSYELSYGAQKMAQREDIDAVICIGLCNSRRNQNTMITSTMRLHKDLPM